MPVKKINKGVYAAVTTPITSTLKPDLSRLGDHCEWLLENGCTGLAPLGTTSEANSLRLGDRLDIIRFLKNSNLPKERIIVGTGSSSLNEAIEVSTSALEAGFQNLLMLPPYYYKNPTEDGLYEFFSILANSIADFKPCIFLYNFPQMTTIPFTLALVKRLRSSYPGIFLGMKDSSGDFMNTLSFIKEFDDFIAFSGSEELIHKNLDSGGYGCISASTNITAPIVSSSLTEQNPKDKENLLKKAASIRGLLSRKQMISGIKGSLSMLKKDSSWSKTIPPIEEMASEEAFLLVQDILRIQDISPLFK